MSKLKVSEIFYSLQGEGMYLGTPSVFLRLFGCNFSCGGFGMPRGELSKERFEIDPNKLDLKPTASSNSLSIAPHAPSTELEKRYKKYEDLPLVHTGCDSYASWDPRFKHLSPMLDVDEVVERILSLLPDRKFDLNKHLIITGGEPLLPGWQKVIPELLEKLIDKGFLSHVTFETNGTQLLSEEFVESIKELRHNDWFEITFSVSSKLPVSGEKFEDAIKPMVIDTYYNLGTNVFFKWVVATEDDIQDVQKAFDTYESGMVYPIEEIPVYLMPVGGTTEGYFLNNKKVAEIAMKNGWRYSPRLQVELWKNKWGS